MPVIMDETVPLLLQGYGWLPNRRRRVPDGVVECRLFGRRATGLCGPEAARFFYDEAHVRRHGAIPGPVLSTLFGHGAVHTLDGAAHRARKAMFAPLATPAAVDGVVDAVGAAWDDAVDAWRDRPRVVLFEESARVIAAGMYQWAGIPLPDSDVAAVAADLVAMVDGFATAGPRHWRARRARQRQEARLAELVARVRAGAIPARPGTMLAAVAAQPDVDARIAAVELLNVVRPATAVSWFVAFAGHALHRWPAVRERLADGDDGYATAFAHEVRRFYPFAPFIGGLAATDLSWRGHRIPGGSMVLLDLYGQDHDPQLWPQPYRFDPQRFVGRDIGAFELVPQGGGDPWTGHRCPGEMITVGLLRSLAVRLARLGYDVPDQDLTIPLHRMPTLPASGFVLSSVRVPALA